MAPPTNMYATRTLATADAIVNPAAAAAAAARSKRLHRRSFTKSKSDVLSVEETAEEAEEEIAVVIERTLGTLTRSSLAEHKQLVYRTKGGKKSRAIKKNSGKQYVRRLGGLQQPSKMLS
eukprot:GHVS01075783.1.p1 GENE.GHVS01075783.1~~GHVS01075783.1.p1  ORF type:complete len:120 (+),score=21.82 GHVS01075783.1:124-483(+)